MKKIFGLSLFSYVWASQSGNNVQGKNNFIIGTQNDVKGDSNVQLSHNVDVNGNNNKLVGANYKIQGDGIQMFGPEANVEFQKGNYPIGKRVLNRYIEKQTKPIEVRDTKNEKVFNQIKTQAEKKNEQQADHLKKIREQILQKQQEIMNQIFELESTKNIFGSISTKSQENKKIETRNQKIQRKNNAENQVSQKRVEVVQIDTPEQKKRVTVIKSSNEPLKVIKQIEKIQSIVNGSYNKKTIASPANQEQNTFDYDSFFEFLDAPTNKVFVAVKQVEQGKNTKQVGFKQDNNKNSKHVSQGTVNIAKEQNNFHKKLSSQSGASYDTPDSRQPGNSVDIVRGISIVQSGRNVNQHHKKQEKKCQHHCNCTKNRKCHNCACH